MADPEHRASPKADPPDSVEDISPDAELDAQLQDQAEDENSTTGVIDGTHRQLPFPVVGIGASAGGLEALTELLGALDPDTGMGFVLVPHLAPTHESMMAQILARSTTMPVIEVQDEPTVEPDHIYVIPPDRSMVIEGGKLRLFARGEGPRRAIDQFLHSLAEDQTFSAIGVILSGMASDGTVGVQEIKSLGGITFAQQNAQYDGMPRSAIATGCIDFVLDPADIARELMRIARHPYLSASPPDDVEQLTPTFVSRILRQIQQKTGVDFSHYKRNTLHRRIARRMVLHRIDRVQEYLQLLQANPTEAEALYQDILINVTSFFRNPGAFDALKQVAFPRLMEGRSAADPVRVWVLGCSSGEEAYSLAMTLTEFGQARGRTFPVQIFATDLNADGIERARQGVYPRSIAEEVAPERLRQFFVESGDSYRVVKSIRDMCVFARHNGITDPPFSRMDLISCRNLLIYLDHVLQQRMIPLMHYALRQEGFLWLGSSETIGTYRDLFDLTDPRHKIYRKRTASGRSVPALPLQPSQGHWRRTTASERESLATVPPSTPGSGYREADRALLGRYAPPSVVVNSDLDIVQFRGDTRPFIVPASGRASLGLFKMLHDSLQIPVRNALNRMDADTPQAVRLDNLQVEFDGGTRRLTIEIIPVRESPTASLLHVIVFDETGRQRPPEKERSVPPVTAAEQQDELARLRQELGSTKEYLQAVIEQQEAANEELQSANEEIQSANEELQSINEELETSKEEIQSSNEELATVNDELHNRNAELNQSNNDLINLLGSVQMAIVMVGPDLRIRRFTPSAERLLNLIGTDIGRPITDIKLNVDVPELESMLTDVMASVTPRECEAQDRTGCWYSVRMRPYRTLDNRIDGAVLVLVDVDALKAGEESLREADRNKNEFMALLAHELRNPLAPMHNVVHLLRNPARDNATIDWAADVLGRQTRAMSRLVDDLLDISRMTRNRIQLRVEIAELRPVVERALEPLSDMLRQRNQTVTLASGGDNIHVSADPFRLQQVFGNLLHNASKFTPEGGHISVDIRRVSGEDIGAESAVEVRVADNGIGMSPEVLSRVFEPFTQGDASLERQQGGLGIGLTLARNLVQLHGGTLRATSDGPGRGAEFTVRLPVASAGSLAASPDLPSRAPASTRSRRILLIDDNHDGRDALAMLLRQSGHEVSVRNDGVGVVNLARQLKPDVVILDIGLPGTNGYAIAQSLRRTPDTSDVLLLALTGYGGEEDRRKAADAGFDAHYTKPVDIAVLRDRLNHEPLRDR